MSNTLNRTIVFTLASFLTIILTGASCRAESTNAPVEVSITSTPTQNEATPTAAVAPVTAISETVPSLSATATPIPPTVSPTATSTYEPSPSPSVEQVDWNLKIAYAVRRTMDNSRFSELWVIDSPGREPRLLLSYKSVSTLAANRVSWSWDGNHIAYGHNAQGDTIAVSIINVSTLETKQLGFTFPRDPFDSGDSAGINLSHDSWSLDDRWVHATLIYFRPETNFPLHRDLLLSTTGNEVIELDERIEFVAWSRAEPDQFLYILHPNSEAGWPTVHVGQVGREEPVASITDLGEYAPGIRFNVAWSPDGARAIATSYDVGRGNSSVVQLDLSKGTWQLLPYQPKGRASPMLWSPNNEWVALWHGQFYLWAINEIRHPTIQVPRKTDQIMLLTWLPDKNWLIYQDGEVLYALDPERPKEPLQILDLANLPATSEQDIHASVWVPPSP